MLRTYGESQFDIVSDSPVSTAAATIVRLSVEIPANVSPVWIGASTPKLHNVTDVEHLITDNTRVRTLQRLQPVDAVPEAVDNLLDPRKVLSARGFATHKKRHSVPYLTCDTC